MSRPGPQLPPHDPPAISDPPPPFSTVSQADPELRDLSLDVIDHMSFERLSLEREREAR